ncbi:hypothetical protein MN116_004241 [Schistosoma mekongi]|uniref:Uncharacterized protein n=1 Tax=Schistosoma mekongi TaxID=38744 RepID=A0AAE2D6I7_SCHME|nr:hypothetical protein MN116_004241 [Schistosoma mekongi]
MDPFQKRDKIPRTPPGQSFMDKSYILDGTMHGDCSIYDESGSYRPSVYGTVQKYTLTFDNGTKTSFRNSCDIVSLDISLSLKPNKPPKNCDSRMSSSNKCGLFTSSPVNESTPRLIRYPQKECDLHLVGGGVPSDQENIAPSQSISPKPVTVKKLPVKRKRVVSSDQLSVTTSVTSTSPVFSTVRQLRARRYANPVNEQSLSQQSESSIITSSVQQNRSTRSTKRKLINSCPRPEVNISPIVTVTPDTPQTLVPKHRRIQPTNIQRKRHANLNNTSYTSDFNQISTCTFVENDSVIHQQPSTVRKRPKVQPVLTTEDEPIAARLRRNTRVSYSGTKV